MERSVWIGFDPREADGYAVTRTSLERHLNTPVVVRGLDMKALRDEGLYTRETRLRDGKLYDVVSRHDMATEFAISRFFVPLLVRRELAGRNRRDQPCWAVFMDSDMLVLDDINRLFEQADPRYAVQVVKHNHRVKDGSKMDGQTQTPYHRKNWSSVILFNVNHHAHDALDLHILNNTKGLSLHQFCWVPDNLIGELSPRWNFLEGYSQFKDMEPFGDTKPSIVHFTEGLPSMGPQYDNTEHSHLWHDELRAWAR